MIYKSNLHIEKSFEDALIKSQRIFSKQAPSIAETDCQETVYAQHQNLNCIGLAFSVIGKGRRVAYRIFIVELDWKQMQGLQCPSL